MTNWPVAGGTVRDIAVERNLRDIRRRGGELAASALSKVEAKELFPQLVAPAKRQLIFGEISATGTIVLGAGFSSEKTAAGSYTITLATEAASTLVVTATCKTTFGGLTIAVSETTKKVIKIRTFDTTNNLADVAFTFHAVG